MKKNSEYVGVDEKFVPKDEKYVNDSILGNKEETKSKLKKGLKIGLTAWLIWVLVVIAFFVICVMFIFNHAKNVNKQILDMYGGATEQIMDGTQFQQDLMGQAQQIQQQVNKQFEQQEEIKQEQEEVKQKQEEVKQKQEEVVSQMSAEQKSAYEKAKQKQEELLKKAMNSGK